jgi:hypothetical protein
MPNPSGIDGQFNNCARERPLADWAFCTRERPNAAAMVLNHACPPETSVRSIDCPISRDLFHPMGPASGPPNDPNAALWSSIRPGPPPSWRDRVRERVATFWLEADPQRVGKRWRARLATYPSAQDGLSSAIFGPRAASHHHRPGSAIARYGAPRADGSPGSACRFARARHRIEYSPARGTDRVDRDGAGDDSLLTAKADGGQPHAVLSQMRCSVPAMKRPTACRTLSTVGPRRSNGTDSIDVAPSFPSFGARTGFAASMSRAQLRCTGMRELTHDFRGCTASKAPRRYESLQARPKRPRVLERSARCC